MNVTFEVRTAQGTHAIADSRREAERIMTALQNRYLLPFWIVQASRINQPT